MSAAAMNVPQMKYKNVMVASKYWSYITKLYVWTAATIATNPENKNKMNLNIESSSVDRGLEPKLWHHMDCDKTCDNTCDTKIGSKSLICRDCDSCDTKNWLT